MIVVDASAAVELLVQSPLSVPIERRVREPGETLHAPHLFDVEVVQALRGLLLRREVETDRVEIARRALNDLAIVRYAHRALLVRAWELRHFLSVYDGVYVALAELLGATLVTADARLAKTRGHRAEIELYR